MAYYVAVHGGAGFHTRDDKEVRRALRRACTRCVNLLRSGQSACDAVVDSIIELEDSECLNAGYGANLTKKGTVECDAAIMDGSGAFGSVGAVSGVKNPIRLAKAILDQSRVRDPLGCVAPLILVSAGAHEFASASNILTVPPDTMISSRAHSEWKMWGDMARTGLINDTRYPDMKSGTHLVQDTVGSVVLDASGSLAAGVSSGGLLLKLPGRVGEAAVFGAGCWAHCTDATTGIACSVSGTGEAIIRSSLARSLSEAVSRSPEDPHEELRRVLVDDLSRQDSECGAQDPSAGVIVLTKEPREDGTVVPRLWCAFNTATMAIAYASSEDLKPKSVILRRNTSESWALNGAKSVYLTVLPWTIE